MEILVVCYSYTVLPDFTFIFYILFYNCLFDLLFFDYTIVAMIPLQDSQFIMLLLFFTFQLKSMYKCFVYCFVLKQIY